MLKHETRVRTVGDTLAILSLDTVQATGEDGTKLVGNMFPSTHTGRITLAEWIEKVLHVEGGVISALPKTESHVPTTVSLDKRAACGNASYWEVNLASNAAIFNGKKSRSTRKNCTALEAVTLQCSVPQFLPEGDAFGIGVAEADALLDSGLKVEVRADPYKSEHELVQVKTHSRQISSCCSELALLFSAAERGIAPAVIASFFSDVCKPSDRQCWSNIPKQLAESHMVEQRNFEGVPVMVTVSQLSTFSLDDVMWAIRRSPLKARKDHLVGVLKTICGPTFEQIRELCKIHKGFGTVKLNLKPECVVFCPELVPNAEAGWNLNGEGYMPISKSFVDGLPKLVDFNSVTTLRIREEAYSEETAYAMSCMLLLSFTRAVHGPMVSNVLWHHLLEDGDKSGFVGAIRAIESKSTNTSAFLASLAANSYIREHPELSKAVSGVVCDMDRIVRLQIITNDGKLNGDITHYFEKLVSLLTSSSQVDTRIFKVFTQMEKNEGVIEAEYVAEVERVKTERFERLKGRI